MEMYYEQLAEKQEQETSLLKKTLLEHSLQRLSKLSISQEEDAPAGETPGKQQVQRELDEFAEFFDGPLSNEEQELIKQLKLRENEIEKKYRESQELKDRQMNIDDQDGDQLEMDSPNSSPSDSSGNARHIEELIQRMPF